MTMRAVIIVAAVLVQSTATLDAETLTCSTSSQGYHRICQDQHGHHCIEWERDGVVIRDLTARTPGSFPEDGDICPPTEKPDK